MTTKRMTKKAPSDLLEALHGLIAKDMRDKLERGDCEAKDWAVIVKFLKDNGIDTLIDDSEDAGAALARLMNAADESIRESMSMTLN